MLACQKALPESERKLDRILMNQARILTNQEKILANQKKILGRRLSLKP